MGSMTVPWKVVSSPVHFPFCQEIVVGTGPEQKPSQFVGNFIHLSLWLHLNCCRSIFIPKVWDDHLPTWVYPKTGPYYGHNFGGRLSHASSASQNIKLVLSSTDPANIHYYPIDLHEYPKDIPCRVTSQVPISSGSEFWCELSRAVLSEAQSFHRTFGTPWCGPSSTGWRGWSSSGSRTGGQKIGSGVGRGNGTPIEKDGLRIKTL